MESWSLNNMGLTHTRSTYMWFLKKKYFSTTWSKVVEPKMWNCGHGGLTLKFYTDFQLCGGQCLYPCVVPRSTILWFLLFSCITCHCVMERCDVSNFLPFSLVTQLCPTLRDPMHCSTPGFPVHHQLLELTQTHVHLVSDTPTISSTVVPFLHLQSLPASGSFQVSQFFASGGQNIGISASASVLPMNVQYWFPLGGTG